MIKVFFCKFIYVKDLIFVIPFKKIKKKKGFPFLSIIAQCMYNNIYVYCQGTKALKSPVQKVWAAYSAQTE